MKGKFYNEIHGAEILEKDSSIVYTLREESFAERVEKECVNLLKSNDYFKVSRRGNKVRIGWSLALEIRLLRTICKIKYINTGPLGNFSMITAGRNMEQLKE